MVALHCNLLYACCAPAMRVLISCAAPAHLVQRMVRFQSRVRMAFVKASVLGLYTHDEAQDFHRAGVCVCRPAFWRRLEHVVELEWSVHAYALIHIHIYTTNNNNNIC